MYQRRVQGGTSMSRRKEITTVCFDADVFQMIEDGKKEFADEHGVLLSTSGYLSYLVKKNAKVD